MKQKEYFYKEDGKLKQFIYCSLCGAGPFKKTEYDKISYICGEKQKMFYCNECKLHHNVAIKKGVVDES